MNENNIQIIELKVHIIDLLDFKSTTSTRNSHTQSSKKHRELDVENKKDTIIERLSFYLYTLIRCSLFSYWRRRFFEVIDEPAPPLLLVLADFRLSPTSVTDNDVVLRKPSQKRYESPV